MKRGDLVTITPGGFDSLFIFEKPNSNPDIKTDVIHRGEVHLVVRVGKSSVKILTPRGIVGWIWALRVGVVG